MLNETSPQTTFVTAQRRRREKTQRYQTILKTSERLFCDQGYSKTKMQDVATAAEVAVGTVYLHFRNKEDLMIRLLDNISFEFRSYLGEAFRKGNTPMKRFDNAGRQLFNKDFWRLNRSHLIILFRESLGVSLEVEARRRAILERLSEDTEVAILDIMKEYGRQDRFAAETISMAIGGVFERITRRYVVWEDRCDEIDSVVRKVMEFIGGGLMKVLKELEEGEPEKRE